VATIRERLASLRAAPQWNWSAAQRNDEALFRSFLEKARPRIALEIGTHHGVSTAIIAEHALAVHTIDVLEYPTMQDAVWQALGVADRITRHVVKGTLQKTLLAASIPFDFAFIDGSHLYESIQVDWEITKRCGNVLFHDYANGWPDVDLFIQETRIRAEIARPFAWWREDR
jgi:predicted O-methyltransferase YrrM